mmetsp:Transcript_40329/g.52824  ORF Transcript_40329/g.52824 Transcript_40329/m.52824 type:complete len:157 (+) Transcript_40329:23-493(+)
MSGFSATGAGDKPTFYDKMVQDPINWKKRKGSKHEFGIDVEKITPGAEEIRLLGNRHRDCKYYQIGVDVCQMQMLKAGSDNFLACKKPIDAMWRCYTEEKHGLSIRDAPAYTKPYEAKFYDCLFRDASGLDVCMSHFGNMVRAIHRSGESELNTDF